MARYNISVIKNQAKSIDYLREDVFDVHYVEGGDITSTAQIDVKTDLVLIDGSVDEISEQVIRPIKNHFDDDQVPVVLVLESSTNLNDKLSAFELGFDDVISADKNIDEITTRLLSHIYHHIASGQLKSVVETANKAAFSAMQESSNLGNNLQFLLKLNQCSNLDMLAQAFFSATNSYGLNCSLQLRSRFGTRNMEYTGVVKVLETKLLDSLKDVGRFYDFGDRTVINYGCMSVLIKNMPKDKERYGAIKDNIFTLLQGMDSRVQAIDEHQQLEEEKVLLEKLSHKVKDVMKNIESDYYRVMLKIINNVEETVTDIEDKVPALLLNDEEEQFILDRVHQTLRGANEVFSEGLKVSEHFEVLIEVMGETLEKAGLKMDLSVDEVEQKPQRQEDQFANSEVELF